MKRIVTISGDKFIIEGYHDPRRYDNYRVYDFNGNRPFEAGHISVKGKKMPLCVPINFHRLRDAKRWLADGCPTRHNLTVLWAVHSAAADAALGAISV